MSENNHHLVVRFGRKSYDQGPCFSMALCPPSGFVQRGVSYAGSPWGLEQSFIRLRCCGVASDASLSLAAVGYKYHSSYEPVQKLNLWHGSFKVGSTQAGDDVAHGRWNVVYPTVKHQSRWCFWTHMKLLRCSQEENNKHN